VASLSAENGRLKADMERKSTDLASALEGAMKGQSEAETRAKSQERTLAALEADREALRRQVEAVRTEKTNDESAVLEKAEALRAENADLKQKMASLEENLQEATAQKQLVATRLDERERQARAQEIALKEQTARAVEAQRMAALREQEQKQQEQKESQSQKLAAAATPVRRAEPAPVAPPPSKAAAAPARSAGTQISALEDALRDVMGAGRKPAPAESDEAQELAQAEMLNDMTPASGDEDTPEPDQVSEAPAPMMKRLPERAPVQVPEIYSGPSEAQKLEGRLLEETKVSRPAPPVVQAPAPVRPSPVVAETIPAAPPPPISAAPPPAPAPAASSSLYAPRLSVENFLQKAGISPQGGVHLVNKASGADHLVHQWKTDAVFGSAEQMPMTDGASFEQRVQDYLKKAKKGCAGDFASSPDRSLRQGEIQAQTYELACVGSASSSASILFLGGQGAFTVLAHEAPLEQMEKVMDIRDRLLSSFGNAAES
ncbi:MAG: hypothetical protein K9G62_08210, partial [Alphaproteobacteria bacterium]|nr:hypothetical protein [Alphaproteobacteria bacterium]